MRRLYLVLCYVTLLPQLSCAQPDKPAQRPRGRAHVMVLGTFHFVRGQSDMYRVQTDDVRSPKRQGEIVEVLALLKKFQPTKIAVEAPYGDDKLQKLYDDYRSGKYQLTGDEIDQFGFRLAKELGHDRIYPIDSKSDMDFDRVMQFAKTHGQEPELQEMVRSSGTLIKGWDTALQRGTILDVLRKMNSPLDLKRNHEFYMRLALIGAEDEYPGADVASGWYARNLRIYANLRRIMQGPQDRVLVIYGQGHQFLLQQYVEDADDLTLDHFNSLK